MTHSDPARPPRSLADATLPPGLDPARLRSPGMVRFFGRIMAGQMAKNFHGVRLARPGLPALPPGRAAVIYCNHPSWWDPAFAIVLATRCFPDRRSFGPIDAAALSRYRFMARIGLFGVEPDSLAGAAALMRIGGALLARPDTLFWITAEGRFTDPRSRPIRLRPGLAALLRQQPDATIVPLALDYPFWTEKKPEALARFGPPVEPTAGERGDPAALTSRLEAALQATLEALASDAIAKDPAAFTTLIEGSAGVGGIYDVWRRLRARLAGRPFDPAHGAHGRSTQPTGPRTHTPGKEKG